MDTRSLPLADHFVSSVDCGQCCLCARGVEPTESRKGVHKDRCSAAPHLCAAGTGLFFSLFCGRSRPAQHHSFLYSRKEGNEALKERGISGRLYSRTIVHLYLGSLELVPSEDTLPPTKDIEKIMNPETLPILNRLGLHLLQRGIAAFDRGFFVLSAAHTREDIDQTIRAFADSLDAMIAEGALGKELMSG